jgi:hypothetical protein
MIEPSNKQTRQPFPTHTSTEPWRTLPWILEPNSLLLKHSAYSISRHAAGSLEMGVVRALSSLLESNIKADPLDSAMPTPQCVLTTPARRERVPARAQAGCREGRASRLMDGKISTYSTGAARRANCWGARGAARSSKHSGLAIPHTLG